MTFDVKSVTNIPGFDVDLLSHDHEEADTLPIILAIDISKSNSFSEYIVYSSDEDVFNCCTLLQPASKCHFFPQW